jgi:methionyl-tRNA formyltransferase
MKLVLLGSGAFALPTYQRLARDHEVSLVVTQPDRPAGRGRRLTPTPVGEWAEAAGLEVLKTGDASGTDRERIRSAPADAWVVIAFGQKLSPELLEDRFAINLHASLLPRWRGAAPIHHAILTGDAVTGSSVITLAERMDAGLVLGQSRREIEPTDTAGDLHDRLAEDGPELVARVLDEKSRDALRPEPQDEAKVTLATKLDKRRDGWVDFKMTASEARCRINGLSPWPAATVRFKGEDVKLLRARESALALDSEAEPGTVIDAELGVVACRRGGVELMELQAPGKAPMPWAAFARSRGVSVGDVFEGGPR